jgi:hypothetical protein
MARYSLQGYALHPSRYHLPQFNPLSVVSDLINELNHSLGESPFDLIVFGNVLADTPRSVFY